MVQKGRIDRISASDNPDQRGEKLFSKKSLRSRRVSKGSKPRKRNEYSGVRRGRDRVSERSVQKGRGRNRDGPKFRNKSHKSQKRERYGDRSYDKHSKYTKEQILEEGSIVLNHKNNRRRKGNVDSYQRDNYNSSRYERKSGYRGEQILEEGKKREIENLSRDELWKRLISESRDSLVSIKMVTHHVGKRRRKRDFIDFEGLMKQQPEYRVLELLHSP